MALTPEEEKQLAGLNKEAGLSSDEEAQLAALTAEAEAASNKPQRPTFYEGVVKAPISDAWDAVKFISKGLGTPGNLVKIGLDAVSDDAPENTFPALLHKHFVQEDPNYRPGDISLANQKILPTTGVGGIATRIGQDIVTDPVSWLAPYANGSAALRVGSTPILDTVKAAEEKIAQGMGWLPEAISAGAVTSEGLQKGVKYLTPKEQMFASKTFQDAGRKFGEMKDAGKDAFINQISPYFDQIAEQGKENPQVLQQVLDAAASRLPGQGSSVPTGARLMESGDALETAIKDLEQSKVPTSSARNLLERLNDMRRRGVTYGPELDSILDNIRRMKISPLENERAMWPSIKSELEGPVASTIWDLYKEASPEMAALRNKTAIAADVAYGRAGGHVTEMFRQATTGQDIRNAVKSFAEGDVKGFSGSLMMLMMHSPDALNFIAGAMRMPPEFLAQHADKAVIAISQNPQLANTIVAGLAAGMNHAASDSGSLFIPPGGAPMVPENTGGAPVVPNGVPPVENSGPISPNPAPPMQPPIPTPPQPSPQDIQIMQQTGLKSVINGHIIDPNERPVFEQKVMNDGSLSMQQKMKIRQHMIHNDGEILMPGSF